jgi:hypothetical protein
MAAAGFVTYDIKATPSGLLSFEFRSGDDSGAVAPSKPVLGQPFSVGTTQLSVPLFTPSMGGTVPYTWKLERSPHNANTFVQIASGTDLFDGDSTYEDTGRPANTAFDYKLKAVGADSRESPYSDVVTGITNAVALDSTKPTWLPSGNAPTITISDITASSFVGTLSAGATDETEMGLYRWYLGQVVNGVAVSGLWQEVAYPTLSVQVLGRQAGTEWYLRCYAVDKAGNESVAGTDRYFATTTATGVPGEPSEPAAGVILDNYDFNDGVGQNNTDSSGVLTGLDHSHNWPTVSANTSDGGTYSMRSVLNRAGSVVSSYRTEAVQANGRFFGYPTTYWFRWSLGIPAGYTASNLYNGPFWQIHGEPVNWDDLSDVVPQPTIYIAINDASSAPDTYKFYCQVVRAHQPAGSQQIASASYYRQTWGDGVLSNLRGRWHRFVAQIRFDYRRPEDGGTGFFKLWHNGVQVVNFNSGVGMNDLGNYLKWGIYKASWYDRVNPTDIIGVRSQYHDNVAVGGSDCNYQRMKLPGSPGLIVVPT